MLLDKQNQFSADAGETPSAIGSTDSSNILDLGTTRDIGDAATPDNLFLLCQVTTAFASAGGATLQVQIAYAPDNGSGSPGSFTVIEQSAAVAVASLVQGYRFLNGSLPNASFAYRFIKLTYVIGTAVMTAGAMRSALVPSLDAQPTYGRGYVA